MIEIVGGGLLGSIFGGLFRLAPEVLKFFDKKNERQHELSMFTLQTDLEKVRGQFRMEEKYAEHSTEQLKAIQEAFREQAATAKEAGWFVAAVSALVRPGITWALFGMYATVKAAGLAIAVQSGASWQDVVLKGWGADDFAMLNMVLTFWFVGRAIEKYQAHDR
jgi:hypothetical protein